MIDFGRTYGPFRLSLSGARSSLSKHREQRSFAPLQESAHVRSR